jgi:hypothetical protein
MAGEAITGVYPQTTLLSRLCSRGQPAHILEDMAASINGDAACQ